MTTISYPIQLLTKIDNNINFVLPEIILDDLIYIKENNRFITRKTPKKINLHYTLNNEWRNDSVKNEENIIETNKNILSSSLNKISELSYTKFVDSFKIILTNCDLKDYFIQLLFEKSISQKQFCKLYANICNDLISVIPDLSTKLIVNCDKFYDEQWKNMTVSTTNMSYDDLCKYNKLKSKLIGMFGFIGELYSNDIIPYTLMISYYNLLTENLVNINSSEKEQYAECFKNFMFCICKKIQLYPEGNNYFCKTIIPFITSLTTNKSFKPRQRFMFMDILDAIKK